MFVAQFALVLDEVLPHHLDDRCVDEDRKREELVDERCSFGRGQAARPARESAIRWPRTARARDTTPACRRLRVPRRRGFRSTSAGPPRCAPWPRRAARCAARRSRPWWDRPTCTPALPRPPDDAGRTRTSRWRGSSRPTRTSGRGTDTRLSSTGTRCTWSAPTRPRRLVRLKSASNGQAATHAGSRQCMHCCLTNDCGPPLTGRSSLMMFFVNSFRSSGLWCSPSKPRIRRETVGLGARRHARLAPGTDRRVVEHRHRVGRGHRNGGLRRGAGRDADRGRREQGNATFGDDAEGLATAEIHDATSRPSGLSVPTDRRHARSAARAASRRTPRGCS